MPITVDWFVKDRIMFFIYRGNITLDELREAVTVAVAALDEAKQPIHGIHHFGQVTSFPDNLAAVHRTVNPSMGHTRMGHFVGVGIRTAYLMHIGRMIGHLTRTPIWLVPTMRDAVQYLAYKDPTLPNLFAIDHPLANDDLPAAY